MASPNDGLPRARRKSLVDIGMERGLLSSSQSLPSGFEEPISAPDEEIHLTPRSIDTSPRSTSPSIAPTPLDPHLEEPAPYSPHKSLSIPNSPRANKPDLEPIVEAEADDTNDGPTLKMDDIVEPPREALFEPDTATEPEVSNRTTSAAPLTIAKSHMPSLSTTAIDIHSGPNEELHKSGRFARLTQTFSYSATTPASTTSKAPLASALSFFSKLFSPLTGSADEASATAQASSTASIRAQSRLQSRSNDPEASSSHNASSSASSGYHTRYSSDVPRATSSMEVPATRPTYVSPFRPYFNLHSAS
jgi:hypothetical protein